MKSKYSGVERQGETRETKLVNNRTFKRGTALSSVLYTPSPYLAGCIGSHIGNLTGVSSQELSQVKLNLV